MLLKNFQKRGKDLIGLTDLNLFDKEMANTIFRDMDKEMFIQDKPKNK